MGKVDQDKMTRFHEAAHAVFAHDQSHLRLRYIEVCRRAGDGRQDFTGFSTPGLLGPHEAFANAVMSFVGEYAGYRALPDDERTGYKEFEVFMEDADPDGRFPDLDEFDNPGPLSDERFQYLTGAEEWRDYRDDYWCDDMDALVELRLVVAFARFFVEQWPESLRAGTLDERMFGWRSLRACYEDASQKAFEFIYERWPEITAVASHLMTEGHLEGEEVREIIESVEAEEVAQAKR